jgi:lysophospholipase L1-like esterase
MLVKKRLMTLSLLLNILFMSLAMFVVYQKGGINYLSNKAIEVIKKENTIDLRYSRYMERVSLFDNLRLTSDNIVFVGDSLTANAEWAELFSNPLIRNRGIGGDTTEGILNRIDKIIEAKPRKIFIMVGINDLVLGKEQSKILQNYQRIIKSIQKGSSETEIFIQSVLPVNSDNYTKVSNEEINAFNSRIKKMASDLGVEYIDLHSLMVDDKGDLKSNLTHDGIHINGEGYLIWKKAIESVVQD